MDLQDKGTPPISKQAAFSKAASYFGLALDTLVDVMKTSTNDSNRVAAANKIIDKILPNLKSEELTGEGGKALIEKIVIIKASDEDKAEQVAG